MRNNKRHRAAGAAVGFAAAAGLIATGGAAQAAPPVERIVSVAQLQEHIHRAVAKERELVPVPFTSETGCPLGGRDVE